MAAPSPEQLFDQALRLASPPPAGAPRQVDLRRAISAAYYAVFHATLTAAANEFVGKTKQTTVVYALAYRSVDHRWLRELCIELKKPTPSRRYVALLPPNGIGSNIQAFASAVLELQEKRYAADYDPLIRVRSLDALLAVRTGRSALARFNRASAIRRRAFLGLLLFPPR